MEKTISQIRVDSAPEIPGLVFRAFRGEVDFPWMAEIIASTREVDQVERADTAEDIRKNYEHLTNSDPYQDMLFAEVDGLPVGYSRVTWFVDESNHLRVYQCFGFLRPEWRRKGIGGAMLKYNEDRLRRIAQGHPADLERWFESYADDTAAGTTALLLKAGYQPVRHFYLMIRPDLENIPDLPLPEGLEVRPVHPQDYRKVWDAANEAFRDHWGFVEQTEEDYQSFLVNRNFQPQYWQVAWAGDEVAGSIQAYIDFQENAEYKRLRGWTEGITTCRPWRRQGLAAALIARNLKHFKEAGMKEAALGVDSQNLSGAWRLYERMGFRKARCSTNYRKRMD